MKLDWWARWHAWRTRPRSCLQCGERIDQPADGVRALFSSFCSQDCVYAYERESQEL